ncbi:hypothetical protein [Scytonema sp. NUACC26]|uniref:hypothetical protein n=1 Tax=Scytonema sp. NUACC26 TaxID=3140176 RepID=UPI0034DBF3AF
MSYLVDTNVLLRSVQETHSMHKSSVQAVRILLKFTGNPSHDARLVAAMIAHNLTNLLTFNTSDFRRFSEITAIAPHNIL